MARARAAALKKAPGKIKSSELENEGGKLIYAFDIAASKTGVTEVNVDAITGRSSRSSTKMQRRKPPRLARKRRTKRRSIDARCCSRRGRCIWGATARISLRAECVMYTEPFGATAGLRDPEVVGTVATTLIGPAALTRATVSFAAREAPT
jgi:hypothetical protein